MIVVDASAALSSVLPSQATAASAAFFQTVSVHLTAPAVFAFEIRNALLKFERRRMLDPDEADEASAALAELIAPAAWSASSAEFVRLFALARREGLSVFDAAYLDLALREGAAIASRDGPLIEAARRRGVEVHDLR